MIIYYESVILRAVEERDMDLLKEMLNSPEIEYMTEGFAFPISDKSQRNWFEHYDNQKELRCIIETKNHAAIGMIGLADMDWKNRKALLYVKAVADSKRRQKNDIYDAMRGLLTYVFDELNWHCVYGLVLDYNIFSIKNLERCGFVKEGILRSRIYKRGKYHDQISYSLLKEDYIEMRDKGMKV